MLIHAGSVNNCGRFLSQTIKGLTSIVNRPCRLHTEENNTKAAGSASIGSVHCNWNSQHRAPDAQVTNGTVAIKNHAKNTISTQTARGRLLLKLESLGNHIDTNCHVLIVTE